MTGHCCCAQASLERLDQKSVDLYQIHWPGFPILNAWANDAFCKGLVKCQKQGLAKAVGVSNYNVKRLQRAHDVMKVSLGFSFLACDAGTCVRAQACIAAKLLIVLLCCTHVGRCLQLAMARLCRE